MAAKRVKKMGGGSKFVVQGVTYRDFGWGTPKFIGFVQTVNGKEHWVVRQTSRALRPKVVAAWKFYNCKPLGKEA